MKKLNEPTGKTVSIVPVFKFLRFSGDREQIEVSFHIEEEKSGKIRGKQGVQTFWMLPGDLIRLTNAVQEIREK